MTVLRDKIADVFECHKGQWTCYVLADSIIAALPAMVAPLVWRKSHIIDWDGDYHTFPTAYTIRCVDELGYKWTALGLAAGGYCITPEAACAAAEAHHNAAVVAAFTWPTT